MILFLFPPISLLDNLPLPQVTTMTNAKLLRSLENCIRVGRPLLIEDIMEHIEPALEPVLQKATFK